MKKKNEFYSLINPILKNEEFQKLKYIDHHGITRYDHCLRVSYYTYLITKGLHLHYKEATTAALLHDFFQDEVKEENSIKKLRKHPTFALQNAKKYFSLTSLQEDIIVTHMFPITFTPPKYLESWIVDIIDDISAIYERGFSTKKQLSQAKAFLILMIIHFIKTR